MITVDLINRPEPPICENLSLVISGAHRLELDRPGKSERQTRKSPSQINNNGFMTITCRSRTPRIRGEVEESEEVTRLKWKIEIIFLNRNTPLLKSITMTPQISLCQEPCLPRPSCDHHPDSR